MPLSKKEVKHVAELSRIALTEEEENKFTGDISAILGFVEKLNEVNTAHIAPATGETELTNIMRDDAKINSDIEERAATLLEVIPEKQERWVKVKKIFS